MFVRDFKSDGKLEDGMPYVQSDLAPRAAAHCCFVVSPSIPSRCSRFSASYYESHTATVLSSFKEVRLGYSKDSLLEPWGMEFITVTKYQQYFQKSVFYASLFIQIQENGISCRKKVYILSGEAQLYLTSREGIPAVCLWNGTRVKVPLYPAAKAHERWKTADTSWSFIRYVNTSDKYMECNNIFSASLRPKGDGECKSNIFHCRALPW